MLDPSQIVGSIVLAAIAVVFHLLSNMPVNTKTSKLAKWVANLAGWSLITAGVALAKWDEYAIALILFEVGIVVLGFRAYYLQTQNKWIRWPLIVLSVVGALVAYPITAAKKGNKPWSDIVSKWTYESSPNDTKPAENQNPSAGQSPSASVPPTLPPARMVTMTQEQFQALMGAMKKQSQPLAATGKKGKQTDSDSDLQYVFFGKDRLMFEYKNPSRTAASKPKIAFAFMDLTNPYFYSPTAGAPPTPQPFPIPVRVLSDDYVRAGDAAGNEDVLKNFTGHVKTGDVILGFAMLTCINCIKQRAYYVYWKAGEGGWYAEADANSLQIPRPSPTPYSDEQIKEYVDKLVPMDKREKMTETFSR
jgi:hypothetical protein